VLGDLAQLGAIVGARSAGVDALGPALDALIAAQEAPLRVTRTKPPPRVEVPPRGQIARVEPAREARAVAPDVIHETFTISETPPPPPAEPQDITPSSLADAVMRELSDAPTDTRSSNPPPIVEPGELRPRTSSAPSFNVRAAEPIPSLAPDAIVPDDAGDASEEPAANAVNAYDALAKDDLAKDDFLPLFGDPTEVDAPVEAQVEPSAPLHSAPLRSAPQPSAPLRSVPIEIESPPDSDGRRHTPLSSVATQREPADAIPLRTIRWPYVAVGALAAVVAVAMTVAKPSAPPAAASEAPAEAPATPATGVPVPSDTSGVAYSEIPPGLDVAAGQGLLEITASHDAAVRVDGAPRGSGPKVRVPLSAGPHEVRVLEAGAEHAPPQVRLIEVRAGVAARVDLTRAP